jgi:hypothetical protein
VNDLPDEVLKSLIDIRDRLDSRNMTDHDMLIRLNTMSDQMLLSLREIKDSHASQMASLTARVTSLEQARWMMLGAAGVIGCVASVAVEFFRKG